MLVSNAPIVHLETCGITTKALFGAVRQLFPQLTHEDSSLIICNCLILIAVPQTNKGRIFAHVMQGCVNSLSSNNCSVTIHVSERLDQFCRHQ